MVCNLVCNADNTKFEVTLSKIKSIRQLMFNTNSDSEFLTSLSANVPKLD